MKYKFRWLSLIVVIGIYLPGFFADSYLKEGSSSHTTYFNIFSPIFLIWIIWACWKILFNLKQKIYPTTEEAILASKNNEFNELVDGKTIIGTIAAESKSAIVNSDLTIGKIFIGTLRFIWGTIKFLFSFAWGAIKLIFQIIFALVLVVISNEISPSKKSSPKKSSSNNSSSNNKSPPKRKTGIIKPSNYGDRDKAIEWEFDGEYLRPSYYGDRDKVIEWEFDGEYLRPRHYGDRDKTIEWKYDSGIPIPVVAKAAGII